MPSFSTLEAVVALTPGEAAMRIVVAVAFLRTGGVPVTPRPTVSGTRVPLPARAFGGGGEFVVTVRGDETRVRLEGVPPAWPLSIGWERRWLKRVLEAQILRFAAGDDPA